MKKSINIIGLVVLLILLAGIIFKRLHLPGAGIMVTLSIVLFALLYLPVFMISLSKQMKSEGSPINNLILFLGFPGIIMLSFGILAKIMHWPGASMSIWIGISIILLILIVYLLFFTKSNSGISMISVLIVVILLGSFSFNMFRIGKIRSMDVAYNINGNAFNASSRIFWRECEKIMKDSVLDPDALKITSSQQKELMNIHSLVQETDLVIGAMLEKIRAYENSPLTEKSSKSEIEAMSAGISNILLSEDGLPKLNENIAKYQKLIDESAVIDQDEKEELKSKLEYLFKDKDEGLIFKYLGIYGLSPQLCANSLVIWKNNIWETEYRILKLIFPTK
ncbi:MAG: hypothetical protein H6538_04280 [Bacteroidales bacterium]|nr:hypothetical protein [Bacteroidales bacterium]MCB8999878.1 hypothetical protein [Bacteroidales bacterium]